MLGNLFNRIFRKMKQPDLDQEHVWGILTPVWIHMAFKQLAKQLQLPLGFLMTCIFEDWLRENFKPLTSDLEERTKYRQYLIRQDQEKHEEI